MTARDDYPYLAGHSSCDSRMEHQDGGSEYTRALDEIDRLRAEVEQLAGDSQWADYDARRAERERLFRTALSDD